MKDAVSVVKQYDYSGKMLREIEPRLGSAGGFVRKRKHCILLLITRRQTTYSFKAKEGNQQYIKTKSRF
jgi:prolyl oligopeptidase